MQVFCFLIGSIALLHVRKQKIQSASLFEQRKHGAQQKPMKPRYSDFVNGSGNNRSGANGDDEIELSRMEIESIPLIGDTSNNSNHHSLLEVV